MPIKTAQELSVLIPSYQPDTRLRTYVERLIGADVRRIVVVDDGSGSQYDDIYSSLQAYKEVTVLRYPDNRGKGFALRHGLQSIAQTCPDSAFVITADSDGQHTVADVLRMADALGGNAAGLLLGSRDFTAAHVPPKSRMGNTITSRVFQALYGQKIGDTQTGLRGFSCAMIPRLLRIKGDRYDYEMNQLIHCAIEGVPIRSLPIETVYENNNEGSHFRAVVDSWRIYRLILARFVRFMLSSMFCFVVDYCIYLLVNSLLKTYVPALDLYLSIFFIRFMARIGIAAAVARVVSATVNYFINKRMVFYSQAAVAKSFLRYVVTVIAVIILSSSIVSSLHIGLGMSETLTKIPVDLLLFFVSYYLQRRWVFGNREKEKAQKNNG